jgi:YggL 50S ribosome-binding protein
MSAPCPVFGFHVSVDVSTGGDARALWRELEALLESRGLMYVEDAVVGASERVVQSESSQATDADRDAVDRWLSEREDVDGFDVGEIEDLKRVA